VIEHAARNRSHADVFDQVPTEIGIAGKAERRVIA
jgi:hypothetical protein